MMSDASLQRTPLFETHRAAGARLVPFAGWEMPVQYAGVIAEARAVRETAGVFDVSHMGRVRVRGADALAFLQFVTVNDVSRLPGAGGAAQYSLLCNEAGGVVDDIIVYRLGVAEFLLVVNASNRTKALSWLRGHASRFPDLVLEDESERTGLLAAQGPEAVAKVSAHSDQDLTVLPRFGLTETVIAGVPVLAARTGYTGEDGVELFCRAEDLTRLWTLLLAEGVTPCGLGARDALRLEAALPLYGHEMDETISPYEARLGWVIRLEKPDFLGKMALQAMRVAKNRRVLVGLAMEGRAIPRDGYAVLHAETGEPVGVVTSGTFSPTLNRGIALARLQSGNPTAPGTIYSVLVRETRHRAHIADTLPFYRSASLAAL